MQLHECLLLAVSRSIVSVSGAKLSFDRDVWDSLLSHVSITPDRESQRYAQGSIISMLRCIVTEWGSNSQTNFYIPPEYYSGYSYLFQDSEHSAWHSIESRFASPIHSNTRSNIRELRHTFVHAEEHKLHRFHHDVHNVRAKSSMHLPNMMASSTTSPMTFISLKNESFQFALHNPDHSSSIISHSGHVAEFKPAQMTIPYIHPQLNVPVPPLHLPWYYGALCWSFTLAGIVMLSLPQKWTLRGGWRGNVGRQEQYQRHWFPYRAFAWVLIVWQSPCSFLADYIHMTSISPWHVIDRVTACTMMSMEIVKLVIIRPYTRPLFYTLYLACLGIAMFCFLKGQESLKKLHEDGFVFWHSGWHCYPIMGIIVHSLDYYSNQRWGQYYPFEEDQDVGNVPTRTFERGSLSTIPIHQFKALKGATMAPKPIMVKRGCRFDLATPPFASNLNDMTSPALRVSCSSDSRPLYY